MEFVTPVEIPSAPGTVTLGSRIMLLGSCFADNIGARLQRGGFDVCINPFGTLYNPASLSGALSRLADPVPFAAQDCVETGLAGQLVCSWQHHTSFARGSVESFLEYANAALEQAAAYWQGADTLIVTLGTAFVWELVCDGRTVSNCLKRPAAEFRHRRLSVAEILAHLEKIRELAGSRKIIFTVSPVRHVGDGAHQGQLSKASLLLALDSCLSAHPEGACYFPAYELLLDELRDYRFYAADMKHPSEVAVEFIWERFLKAYLPKAELEKVAANEKAARFAAHRPMHQAAE